MDLFSSQKVLGNKYILLAGSKEIQSNFDFKTRLAIELGKLIAREDGWVLINGGALNKTMSTEPKAIDYFGALGAYEECKSLKKLQGEKILTLKPSDQSKQTFHDLGKIEILNKKHTSALRRFEMVARADAIITIEGDEGSTNILELGISLNKAVLPIPLTGGASARIWQTYENEILEMFRLKKNDPEYETLTKPLATSNDIKKTALSCISVIRKALLPECFIIMPFNKGLDFVYNDCLKRVVEDAGLKPVKADEIPSTGTISNDFYNLIASAKYVIADITPIEKQNNANVYYELGIAHAMKKEVIIINQVDNQNKFLLDPPVDINNRRIYSYNPENLEKLYKEIHAILRIM